MTVAYETDGAVARFTLDNGPHNFLTGEMYRQLCESLTLFLNDDELKVGILAGAPGTSFCAGDDLRADPRPLHTVPRWPLLLMGMPRHKPIVAAVDGWALGGGFQLLLTHSDIRVATDEAKFGFPEIAYGLGGAGGATRLARHLPHTVAMQLLLTGDHLTAPQAHRYDLVNRIVPADELLPTATAIAERIARNPLLGITTEMEAYTRSGDLSAGDALQLSSAFYRLENALLDTVQAFDDIRPTKPEPIDLGDGPGV